MTAVDLVMVGIIGVGLGCVLFWWALGEWLKDQNE